ncbi:MAG TPA: hypothetical protein VFY45_08305 [Baekduia sp.]|nr:hypothetical protein [Baekduia sp.]
MVLASAADDVSEVIRALATLAWPVIVGFIVYGFRKELPGIAKRLRRLSVAGAEAELGPEVRDLDEVTEQTEAQVRPQLPAPKAASASVEASGGGKLTMEGEAEPPRAKRLTTDAVLDVAAHDPALGLVSLVTALEVRVRDLASVYGHDQPQREPWPKLVKWLVDRGSVPMGVASAVDIIVSLRSRIVHGRDDGVDEREVAAVIDSGLRLLRILEAIPDYGYEVWGMVPVFQDPQAMNAHTSCQGVVLWDFDAQGQHRDHHIYPTRREYEPGQRVGWQWSFDHVWPEAWWRDPWDGDTIKLAWSQSAEYVGQPLIQQEAPGG